MEKTKHTALLLRENAPAWFIPVLHREPIAMTVNAPIERCADALRSLEIPSRGMFSFQRMHRGVKLTLLDDDAVAMEIAMYRRNRGMSFVTALARIQLTARDDVTTEITGYSRFGQYLYTIWLLLTPIWLVIFGAMSFYAFADLSYLLVVLVALVVGFGFTYWRLLSDHELLMADIGVAVSGIQYATGAKKRGIA